MKDLIVGPLLIFLGIICIFLSSIQNNSYLQTKATIIDNEKEGYVYIPVLEYEVDGITYEENGEPSDVAASLGKEIIISYNPENPKEFTTDHLDKSIMFILIGIIVLICGIYIFYSTTKHLDFNEESEIKKSPKKIMMNKKTKKKANEFFNKIEKMKKTLNKFFSKNKDASTKTKYDEIEKLEL